MKDKYIREKLTAIFRQTLEMPDLMISENMKASDVSNWDSIRHMQLLANIENEFRIKFSLKEIMRFRTIGDLVILVNDKITDQDENYN